MRTTRPAGLDQVHHPGGDRHAVGRVDDGVEGQVGQVVEGARCRRARTRARTPVPARRPRRGAPRRRPRRRSARPAGRWCRCRRPAVARRATTRGRLDGTQRVATGLHHRACGVVDVVGQRAGARGPAHEASRRARRGSRRGCRSRTGSRTRDDARRGSVGSAPQPSMVSPVTRRPIQSSATFAPTAETVPHHSCPGVSG